MVGLPPADGVNTHCTCIYIERNGRPEIIVYDVHTICEWQVSIETIDIFREFLGQMYCPHCWTCHESVQHMIHKELGRGAALRYEEDFAEKRV